MRIKDDLVVGDPPFTLVIGIRFSPLASRIPNFFPICKGLLLNKKKKKNYTQIRLEWTLTVRGLAISQDNFMTSVRVTGL